MDWYLLKNAHQIDSPSLLIFKDRIGSNIDEMIRQAGNIERLIPHVKTNKMLQVVEMMMEKGITHFKTATIAEAEMAGMAGAQFVLIAHQLVGPKIDRLIQLHVAYPNTEFAVIVDDKGIVEQLSAKASENKVNVSVFVDVNSGMNRSGFPIEKDILGFYNNVAKLDYLSCLGLHVYDGQFRDPSFELRSTQINDSFRSIRKLVSDIQLSGMIKPKVIAGGSPAFSTHSQSDDLYLSPGTTIFWDWGYAEKCAEQHYLIAALVFTRIISKPTEGIVTVDMGHKAVAAENPIDKRIKFLNLENYELISQSEEHGVLSVDNWDDLNVGDALYGIPYHVCPTVNLYSQAHIIEDKVWTDTWDIIARNRKINI